MWTFDCRKQEARAKLYWVCLSIMLAFRSLVIKTCLIEDRSRCSGCQKAKCCSIVRTISSCLGNKAAHGPAFHFAALGGTELSSRADSEGVKPWCVAVNPSLSWPALSTRFPLRIPNEFWRALWVTDLALTRGSLSKSYADRTIEILNNSSI